MADPTIDAWTRANVEYTDARAEQAWAQDEITWGVWQVPESELRALPDVTGKDVVELGCGTAYFGAWLKKAGAARVVGVDPTPAQLETARRCNERFGLGLELVEAFGEEVPLPDASFDLVVSEYGASIWADPYRWIPEAARLLRPGGELVFLGNSTLAILCSPEEDVPTVETLQRPQFGMYRFQLAEQRRRVPPPARRVDPAAARERFRDPRPDRGPGADRRRDPRALRLRDRRVGTEVAGGRDMASAPAAPVLLDSTSPRQPGFPWKLHGFRAAHNDPFRAGGRVPRAGDMTRDSALE